MIINKPIYAFLSVIMLLVLCGCNINASNVCVIRLNKEIAAKPNNKSYNKGNKNKDKAGKVKISYTKDTLISDVISNPVFGDYGKLIFPINSGYMSGNTLETLGLTWYHNISSDKTVEIVNYMRSQAESGKTIFYNIYSKSELKSDPTKKNTGLFYFRGKPGKKFAVVNAGGGFAYVGAMHDSFPHALELSKKGYNAFALIYRPGARTAAEDLARAIAFIFEHSKKLNVDTSDYSLWGGSAGARMSAWLGNYGTAAFGEKSYPRPASVIVNYTGLSEVTGNEPPTYSVVGKNDGIADWRTMFNRINSIKANGTDAEIEVFNGLSHGFGLGIGTVAEGWFNRAVKFWERNMKKGEKTEMENLSGIIPDKLAEIPDNYGEPAKHQGKMEKLTYNTWEAFTYKEHKKKLTKEAWIYLPYNYDKTKKYNVFYISHGGWSNETSLMGTDKSPMYLKHVIDHAVEDGKMIPMILVFPTYNNTDESDSGNFSLALKLTDKFHNELVNDLLPAVESKYSTFVKVTTPEGLKDSRDHRGFGGFSMGSVNTRCTFRYSLDYFRYFMPASGNYTTGGNYMAQLVKNQRYTAKDFFIYAASGTDDFAYDSFKSQIMAMGNVKDGTFTFAKSEDKGNLAFLEKEGYTHDYTALCLYTYNGLCFFWNNGK